MLILAGISGYFKRKSGIQMHLKLAKNIVLAFVGIFIIIGLISLITIGVITADIEPPEYHLGAVLAGICFIIVAVLFVIYVVLDSIKSWN